MGPKDWWSLIQVLKQFQKIFRLCPVQLWAVSLNFCCCFCHWCCHCQLLQRKCNCCFPSMLLCKLNYTKAVIYDKCLKMKRDAWKKTVLFWEKDCFFFGYLSSILAVCPTLWLYQIEYLSIPSQPLCRSCIALHRGQKLSFVIVILSLFYRLDYYVPTALKYSFIV